MMVVLMLMVVVFLYYVITEYFQNSYIDCILFLTLLISHLIWDYYFLPIEILVALSGVNLLSRFFKKKRSQQICQRIIKTKGKIGIFKMKHFFAGIGEIHFYSFLLYLSMSTSPIIGLVIGYTKINLINSIIIALGMILALILVLSRVYRKYFYRDDDD